MVRRVLVTGASSGIGEATALALATHGCELALVARRADRLEDVADRVRSKGGRAESIPVDLSDPIAAAEAAREADARLGGLDGVVNNAGIGVFGPYDKMAWTDISQMVHLNLLAPMAIAHAVLPGMLERRFGRILNVLSVITHTSLPFTNAYAATKSGLLGFSRVMNVETRKRGVTFLSLSPGATDTPIWGEGGPPRAKMLSAAAVAETISNMLLAPPDRSLDEVVLYPPDGIL